MLAWPNELFLAWRWWRIDNEDAGGEVLVTVDGNGNLIQLEHNGAEELIVDDGARVLATVGFRPPPANVFCRPAYPGVGRTPSLTSRESGRAFLGRSL